MIRKITFAISGIVLALTFQNAHAQSDEKKFEAGGQMSLLWLPVYSFTDITLQKDRTNVLGFGGRFGYNFSKSLAFESEVNFFPRDRGVEGGRKTQALFGGKVGKRFENVGVFAKARPGFIRFEKGDYFQPGGCPTVFPPPLGCYRPVATTNFAIDLGGVLEYYPSKNTVIRFDAGDTIIRFDTRIAAADQAPPRVGLAAFSKPAETTHNFQSSVGIGFRF